MDNSPQIMLIEDDIALQKMYTLKFQKEGFTVISALTGNEALNQLRTHTPDIILLDIMLPDMSGLEILERIKESSVLKKIPVIVLTVLPEVIALKKALRLGVVGYLVKSELTPNTVLDHVKMELKLNMKQQ